PGTTTLRYSALTSPHRHTTSLPHLGPNALPGPPLRDNLICLFITLSMLLLIVVLEVVGPGKFSVELAACLRTSRSTWGTVICRRPQMPFQICRARTTLPTGLTALGAQARVIVGD
ncbi:hypothetical protein HOY82DRAFT_640011, partial [Tuber indicum]